MGIRALIVDDEEDVRFLIRAILETSDLGISVAGEAGDGRSAVALVDELDPEIVILDQMMPGMDGIDTALLIRQSRPDQRMIMFTAYFDEHLVARAREAGISDCIPKTQVGRMPDALHRAVHG